MLRALSIDRSGWSNQAVLQWNERVLRTGSGQSGPAHGSEPLGSPAAVGQSAGIWWVVTERNMGACSLSSTLQFLPAELWNVCDWPAELWNVCDWPAELWNVCDWPIVVALTFPTALARTSSFRFTRPIKWKAFINELKPELLCDCRFRPSDLWKHIQSAKGTEKSKLLVTSILHAFVHN